MQATGPSAVRREANPISWVNVVLGGLLFIAPWVLGYSDEIAPYANHLVLGAISVVVGLLAVVLHRGWEWVNVVGAAYTIVAIWLYGYEAGAAIGASIVLGGAIGLVGVGSAVTRHEIS